MNINDIDRKIVATVIREYGHISSKYGFSNIEELFVGYDISGKLKENIDKVINNFVLSSKSFLEDNLNNFEFGSISFDTLIRNLVLYSSTEFTKLFNEIMSLMTEDLGKNEIQDVSKFN